MIGCQPSLMSDIILFHSFHCWFVLLFLLNLFLQMLNKLQHTFFLLYLVQLVHKPQKTKHDTIVIVYRKVVLGLAVLVCTPSTACNTTKSVVPFWGRVSVFHLQLSYPPLVNQINTETRQGKIHCCESSLPRCWQTHQSCLTLFHSDIVKWSKISRRLALCVWLVAHRHAKAMTSSAGPCDQPDGAVSST